MRPESSPQPEPLLQQEVSLYRDLLECLEQEALALAAAQEENILSLTMAKEGILKQLLTAKKAREESSPDPGDANLAELARLQRQAAARNARNREIISASLEVIQEYLNQFIPPGPGLYRLEGRVEKGSGRTLFHRQA